MTTRLHLSLPVADLDASVVFYAALFGEQPDKRRPGFARFSPDVAPLSLSLQGGAEPTPDPNHHAHFGLKFTDRAALDQAAQRLFAAGLVHATEEATSCCFAVQDKHWAVDPDGRPWEVYVVLDDDVEEEAPTTAPVAVDSGACCPAPAPSPSTGCCG